MVFDLFYAGKANVSIISLEIIKFGITMCISKKLFLI